RHSRRVRQRSRGGGARARRREPDPPEALRLVGQRRGAAAARVRASRGRSNLEAPVSATPSPELPDLPKDVEVSPRASLAAVAHDTSRAQAFRAMYEAHVDFVWRNLRRLGVPFSEADDKTQEVFVIAHRRFEDFVDRGHGPRAWLFQIALRVA